MLQRLEKLEPTLLARGVTMYKRLGRNVLYRWLFIATVTHGIWTSVYGVLLTESIPSCLEDACAHEREALFADQPLHDGAGGNSSCLVVQPLNGGLGSCADPEHPGHIGPVLMNSGVGAVRIAAGSRCRLQCESGSEGQQYRASGSTEICQGKHNCSIDVSSKSRTIRALACLNLSLLLRSAATAMAEYPRSPRQRSRHQQPRG